jgi:hypothetical protein
MLHGPYQMIQNIKSAGKITTIFIGGDVSGNIIARDENEVKKQSVRD